MKSFICAGLIGVIWGLVSGKLGIAWNTVEFFAVILSANIINLMIWHQIEK